MEIEYLDLQQVFKISSVPKFCLLDGWTAFLPAVRPGSARCRPPDFLQIMYSHIGFTNFLVR